MEGFDKVWVDCYNNIHVQTTEDKHDSINIKFGGFKN